MWVLLCVRLKSEPCELSDMFNQIYVYFVDRFLTYLEINHAGSIFNRERTKRFWFTRGRIVKCAVLRLYGQEVLPIYIASHCIEMDKTSLIYSNRSLCILFDIYCVSYHSKDRTQCLPYKYYSKSIGDCTFIIW